jgi:hypothetical protein
VTRGWWLLVVALVLLSIGGLMQFGDQSKSFIGPRLWPKIATLTLSLLWIFGAVLSLSWFGRSTEIFRLIEGGVMKASDIVMTLDGVMSLSFLSGVLLFVHAVLTTILAVIVYQNLARPHVTSRPLDELS